jgi:hypothetical protein
MGRDHPLRGAAPARSSAWQASSGADRGCPRRFVEAFAELGALEFFLGAVRSFLSWCLGAWAAVATERAATMFATAIDWDREMPVVVLKSDQLSPLLYSALR